MAASDEFIGKEQANHACRECRQAWPWPRNIRFIGGSPAVLHEAASAVQRRRSEQNLNHLTVHQVTTTVIAQDHEVVVPYVTSARGRPNDPSFPIQVFKTLQLCWAAREGGACKITQDVEYDRVHGDVWYRRDGGPRAGCARVVTLNSWWGHLATALLATSIVAMEYSSNLTTIAITGMSTDDFTDTITRDREVQTEDLKGYFYASIAASALAFFVPLFFACCHASREWRIRIRPGVGDLTHLPDTQLWVFMGLVAFTHLGIDLLVRDVVSLLHPWKKTQAFAALKTQGTRAFLVGYTGDCEGDQRGDGGNWALPARAVFSFLLIALKAAIATRLPSPAILLCLLASCLGAAISVYQMYGRFKDGRRHRKDSWSLKQATQAKGGRPTSEHSMEAMCTTCGRVCGPKDTECPYLSQVDFEEGAFVRLRKDAESWCHDALLGPLAEQEAGVVEAVGPGVRNCGARVCVRPFVPDGRRTQSWWYDAHCLESALDPSVARVRTHTSDSDGRFPPTVRDGELQFEVESDVSVDCDDELQVRHATEMHKRRVRVSSDVTTYDVQCRRGGADASDVSLQFDEANAKLLPPGEARPRQDSDSVLLMNPARRSILSNRSRCSSNAYSTISALPPVGEDPNQATQATEDVADLHRLFVSHIMSHASGRSRANTGASARSRATTLQSEPMTPGEVFLRRALDNM